VKATGAHWAGAGFVLALACTTPPPKTPAGEGLSGEERGQPPFVARLVGPDRVEPGAAVTVELSIDRTKEAGPIGVAVVVPPGTRLESGRVQETVAPGHEPIRRSFVLRLGRGIPPQDLTITTTSRSDGGGAQAVTRYRFGRPEPRLTDPPTNQGAIPLN